MRNKATPLLIVLFTIGIGLPFVAGEEAEPPDNCCDYILASQVECDSMMNPNGKTCYCEAQDLEEDEYCEVNGCEEYEACGYGGPWHIYCCYPTGGGGDPD